MQHKDKWIQVWITKIMDAIRTVIQVVVLDIGFTPTDVSARSLRVGGTMALLTA